MENDNHSVIALHGFLGRPDDFTPIPGVDLFAENPLPFWDWAHRFNQHHSGTLVGYSMGGRLALHALIENPTNWERAAIISAHPGLNATERTQRLQLDAAWAEKFRNGCWEEVLAEWNDQPVFAYDQPIVPSEKEFNRTLLADAMLTWSLGNQEDLRKAIASLPMQIDWYVGEYDQRFIEVASTLTFANKGSQVNVVPKCGHRIPYLNELGQSGHNRIILANQKSQLVIN